MTSIVMKRSNPNALSARLAGKLVGLILAITLVMGLLLCGIDRAFASTLNPVPRGSVTVTGEKIRLGDVFENLEKNADFVLAPAPQPGQELVWNEPTLLRIATAFNLPWRPEQGQEVRIRRDAELVDSATLKAVVRDHLATDTGDAESYNVVFTGSVPEIIVPGGTTPDVTLADFNMQPVGGTFSAIVKVVGLGAKPQLINLRGVAERLVRVPVLKTGLRNGDIIRAENIIWTTQKSNTVRADTIREAEMLIGSTPRRSLSAGEPVRNDSIEMPRMVSRGDLVTMVFSQHGMTLTARGRALEDGASGQVIRVSNTGSNRTIEGRVTGNKEITVNQ